jgi:hypothetical protein
MFYVSGFNGEITNMLIATQDYIMHAMACGCWLRESNRTHTTLAHYLCKYHASKGKMHRVTVSEFYKVVTKYGRSLTGNCSICGARYDTIKALREHKKDVHAY